MKWTELKPTLDPSVYNIKTIVPRMTRLKVDPFLDAIEKHADLESALSKLEALLSHDENRADARTAG
jgi:DNA primase